MSKKLKYVKFLTVYCCLPFANVSPVIVWLLLELWDTLYLLVTEITPRVEIPKYGGNAFDTKYGVIYFEITCTLAYQADIQARCFQNASLERYFNISGLN